MQTERENDEICEKCGTWGDHPKSMCERKQVEQHMEKRRKELVRKEIEKLIKLHHTKYKAGDFEGAKKIEALLASKHGIEGDKRYDVSETNADFEG